MKRVYLKPMVSIESFIVNDYIAAACYTLGCNWEDANAFEKSINNYSDQVNHAGNACGSASSQYISTDESGSVSIKEYNTQQGWLDCVVTSAGGADAIVPGSFVTWNTYASDGRVWHHQGTAQASFPGHPNRS